MKCPKCKIKLKFGIPDFVGSDEICTVSPTGNVEFIICLKCLECGYGIINKGNKNEKNNRNWK